MSQYICKNCGNLTSPIKVTRGSFLMEVILWFFFIIPGIIYSLWRITGKSYVCQYCSSTLIVPTDTVIGQQLLKQVKETNPEMIIKGDESLAKQRKVNNIKAIVLTIVVILLFALYVMTTQAGATP
jgi:DNA-directed RNA polymerase subunit RPC12/RpoP